ncbi:MAG TPA: hypothetical protein PLY40_06545 [Bacillota bacterium]|nr:hypothetical protein [Bacillota bacterium]
MSYGGGAAAGGAAAAAAAAVAEAVKASGAIVRVSPADFCTIVNRAEKPLVVFSKSKFFRTAYHYLTGYKGFVFYTRSSGRLLFKSGIEMVKAQKIWIPS